jgi:hypothetical protein
MLTRHSFSLAIVLSGLGLVGYLASEAVLLDTPNEEDKFFSDTHMLTGVGNAISNNYMGGVETRYMPLNYVFGIETIDRPDYV